MLEMNPPEGALIATRSTLGFRRPG